MAIFSHEHPDRRCAADELFARPVGPYRPPVRLSHLAFMYRDLEANRAFDNNTRESQTDLTFEKKRKQEVQNAIAHLRQLVRHYRPETERDFNWQTLEWYYAVDLGAMRVCWERHTEFVTYTFCKEGAFDDPFVEPVLNQCVRDDCATDWLADWLQDMPGAVIAAVHLAIQSREQPVRTRDQLTALFSGHQVIGSTVQNDGKARVWSDLKIHPDGFMRVLVCDDQMTANQAGRVAKRFLDLSSYRPLALRGLFLARKNTDKLSDADDRLDKVAQRMVSQDALRTPGSESGLLDELTKLAAEIEAITESTTYRFDAARAYYGMVQQRLTQLGEERIEDLQTFTEFLDACLAPAIATCVATQKRQSDLAERAARLTSLLRARVDVALQEQSCEQLKAMKRRTKQQLHLQRMIEVVSVIPVSYYLVALLHYMHSGFARGLLVGLAVPALVGVVFFVIKRLTMLDVKKQVMMQARAEP